jgi:hypothetical protein
VLGCSLLEPGVLVPLGALVKRPLLSLCDCEMAAIGKARLGKLDVAKSWSIETLMLWVVLELRILLGQG